MFNFTSSAEQQPSRLEETLKKLGCTHVPRRILIANNGLAAVKGIRSIRQWLFDNVEDERAIKFVVMASEQDIKASAEFIALADEYIEVAGGPSRVNYGNVPLIVDCAVRANCDAVYPGWGHASENPELPRALAALPGRRIAFLGPHPNAMYALGDKIASTIIAQSIGVPCIAWSGSHITVDSFHDLNDDLLRELIDAACVHSAQQAYEVASTRVHCPVMLKASEGGGGKGIRTVRSLEGIIEAYNAVTAEVPGSPVFVMQLSENSRHIEVQLLADTTGAACALHTRDCSVQRRHQKIIEEAPVSGLTEANLREMERSAMRLAREVGYLGAGTVEYLWDRDRKAFYFLELNPRLQVEHPVTEGITGANLPAALMLVACGAPLKALPDIRRAYGADPDATDAIDFLTATPAPPRGHTIAVRITAENPDDAFRPTTGRIDELEFRPSKTVWGYFSVLGGGQVHEFADSQFGHIFAHGDTREEARRSMILALKQLSISGEIMHTTEYIIGLLSSRDFCLVDINTAWLDGLIRRKTFNMQPVPAHLAVLAAAVHRFQQRRMGREREAASLLQAGHVPSPDQVSTIYKDEALILKGTRYNVKGTACSPTAWALTLNQSTLVVETQALRERGTAVHVGRYSFLFYAQEDAASLRITINGRTTVFVPDVDPTTLRASSNGKLLRFTVRDGEHVDVDEPFCEIEVMKMVLTLRATVAGVISIKASPGITLSPGMILANVTPDDPSTIVTATTEPGPWRVRDLVGDTVTIESLVQQHLLLGAPCAEMLAGTTDATPPRRLGTSGSTLASPGTAGVVSQSSPDNSPVRSERELSTALVQGCSRLSSLLEGWTFPHEVFDTVVHASVNSILALAGTSLRLHRLPQLEKALGIASSPASEVDSSFQDQLLFIFNQLLLKYVQVSRDFGVTHSVEGVNQAVMRLREERADALDQVVSLYRAHVGLPRRNRVVNRILATLQEVGLAHKVVSCLEALVALESPDHNPVVVTARHMLRKLRMPSYEQKRQELALALKLGRSVVSLSEQATFTTDIIASLFWDVDPNLRAMAIELHVRKQISFNPHVELTDLEISNEHSAIVSASWGYRGISVTHRGGAGAAGAVSALAASGEESPSSPTGANATGPVGLAQGGMRRCESTQMLVELDPSDAIAPNPPSPLPPQAPRQMGAAGESGRQWFGLFNTPDDVEMYFRGCIGKEITRASSEKQRLSAVLAVYAEGADLSGVVDRFTEFIRPNGQPLEWLVNTPLDEVTFLICEHRRQPLYLVFRRATDWVEDKLYRNVAPTVAYALELHRILASYDLSVYPLMDPRVFLYHATERPGVRQSTQRLHPAFKERRWFLRMLVLPGDVFVDDDEQVVPHGEIERCFTRACSALEIATADTGYATLELRNHLSVRLLHVKTGNLQSIGALLQSPPWAKRLRSLGVSDVELVTDDAILISSNPTGFAQKVAIHSRHATSLSPLSPGVTIPPASPTSQSSPPRALSAGGGSPTRESAGGAPAASVTRPYSLLSLIGQRRDAAHRMRTTYARDLPVLISMAVSNLWDSFATTRQDIGGLRTLRSSPSLVHCEELVLAQPGTETCSVDDIDVSTLRPATIEEAEALCLDAKRAAPAMLAWRCTVCLPCDVDATGTTVSKRRFVLVANDVTTEHGSFSIQEDRVFAGAVAHAIHDGVPLLYFASNSGARLGIADEIKPLFRIAWKEGADGAEEGEVDYIYLTDSDYTRLQSSVEAEKVEVAGRAGKEVRWRLNAIIGAKNGLGVENLRGSGLIAGAMSKAFAEVPTMSIASGPYTVGIGAYLVRLGRRVIQTSHSSLLLTGARALNRLLGRDVYTSNLQLGGPGIMGPNGVSHFVVQDDENALAEFMRWLMVQPLSVRQEALGDMPRLLLQPVFDGVDRDVQWNPPTSTPYDPRLLITGADGQLGLFDNGTWRESLTHWAQSVVTGRATLGGLPVAVVAVETRPTTKTFPADPADHASATRQTVQAGSVWYPDSSRKTADFLADTSVERLPVVILANWRGFSGGTRDMFDEVLKFGASIVDSLRTYPAPVVVYLPPHADLRGGAWVVLDGTISHERSITLFADPSARAGVLEPAAVVEIKYRDAELRRTMARLDAQCAALSTAVKNGEAGASEKLAAREEVLLPAYRAAAQEMVDLHDNPKRMVAKGAIEAIVPWRDARRRLFAHLMDQLVLFAGAARLQAASANMSVSAAREMLSNTVQGLSGEELARRVQAVADEARSERDAQMARDLIARLGPDGAAALLASVQASPQRLKPEGSTVGSPITVQ